MLTVTGVAGVELAERVSNYTPLFKEVSGSHDAPFKNISWWDTGHTDDVSWNYNVPKSHYERCKSFSGTFSVFGTRLSCSTILSTWIRC